MAAEVHLSLGDPLRARTLAEEAIQVALRVEMPIDETHGQLALARVLRADESADGSGNIEAALDRAIALVQSTGARSYEPQIHVERARLGALRSDDARTQRELRLAHRLFTQMGAVGHAIALAPELLA